MNNCTTIVTKLQKQHSQPEASDGCHHLACSSSFTFCLIPIQHLLRGISWVMLRAFLGSGQPPKPPYGENKVRRLKLFWVDFEFKLVDLNLNQAIKHKLFPFSLYFMPCSCFSYLMLSVQIIFSQVFSFYHDFVFSSCFNLCCIRFISLFHVSLFSCLQRFIWDFYVLLLTSC